MPRQWLPETGVSVTQGSVQKCVDKAHEEWWEAKQKTQTACMKLQLVKGRVDPC